MPAVRGKRTWIKLYPIECMEGSIRFQLDAAERGVWYDLIVFSSLCQEAGTIADRDNRPYPHQFVANRLNITEELLERTLEKCKAEGRIKEDDNGIHITNWKYYQSEYERQKPYRKRPPLSPGYGEIAERLQAERMQTAGKE